jgi:putative membrane protein
MKSSFKNALVRWNKSWILRMALGGILIVPLIYGGLLIWAFWNPVGNVQNLPVAIVNEDVPVQVEGRTLNVGSDITSQIVAQQELKWTETTSDDADAGLNSGRYYLVMRIPSNFSSQLATLDTATPSPASIEVVTNDATNYLVDEVAADTLAGIQGQTIKGLQLEFLDVVYSAIGSLEKEGEEVVNGAGSIAKGAEEAAAGATKVASGASEVATGNTQIATVGDEIARAAKDVPAAADQIEKAADSVAKNAASVESEAATIDQNLADVETKLTARGLNDLAKAVADARSAYDTAVLTPTKDIASVTKAAAAEATRVASQSQGVVAKANEASTKLNVLSSGAQQVSSGAAELASSLTDELAPAATKLSDGLEQAAKQVPPITQAQRAAFTQVLSEPVKVNQTRWNPVAFFGDGFAPYFLPLALYIGAMFLLMVIAPLNSRLMNLGTPVKAALQSFAPLAFFAAIAGIVAVAGIVGLVGVRAAAYLPLLAITIASIVCFVAIVQFLKAWLGVIGSFLAVVLLVLQITGDAGAYPIETFSKFFQVIHPFLPMTYSVDGVRRSIAGGPLWPYVTVDLLVLIGITCLALAGTTWIAYRRKVTNKELLHPEIEIK